MRNYVQPDYPNYPDPSLIAEQRRDALDAHPKIGVCCLCGGTFNPNNTVVVDMAFAEPEEMCRWCAQGYDYE